MIRHVFMCRLKSESGGVAKDTLAENLLSRLEDLPRTTREIVSETRVVDYEI